MLNKEVQRKKIKVFLKFWFLEQRKSKKKQRYWVLDIYKQRIQVDSFETLVNELRNDRELFLW